MSRRARKAVDCLAQALGHEPSEAEISRFLAVAAKRYRESIAYSPMHPAVRQAMEDDDAGTGWLMIEATIKENPRWRVVNEFREWIEADEAESESEERADMTEQAEGFQGREDVLTYLSAHLSLIAALTGGIKVGVEVGDAFLTREEDDAMVKAHRSIWDALNAAQRALGDVNERAGLDDELIAAAQRLLAYVKTEWRKSE